jgi:hypothetical protein
MGSLLSSIGKQIRRSIFISYHHKGDQGYYNLLSSNFHDRLNLITDNSLERQIDSSDTDYIMRRIREHHLHGSSCTVVLCGADTWGRKYVDWEILASLNQGMGLVGVWLPTLPSGQNGGTHKPRRLQDNIDSGYAEWINWNDLARDHSVLLDAIERAVGKSGTLIDNTRARMLRNS